MKILITGGTGSVGRSFIDEYSKLYEIINYSRNEKNIFDFSKDFSDVKSVMGDVSDLASLIKNFIEIKPDIVIHAAALKHVDLGESNQTQFIKTNIIGSYNITVASVLADVKITVGISTDKASEPKSIYGYTKKLMEEMFSDSYSNRNKFICTRFSNVAGSNGSVIPFWKKSLVNGERIKLTDPNMNRLMMSKKDCANLIHKAIEISNETNNYFILSKKIKTVNLYELARCMTDQEIDIIGKRPGEQLNETLISKNEIERTHLIEDGYLIINNNLCSRKFLQKEYSSLTAEKATKEEIEKLVQ